MQMPWNEPDEPAQVQNEIEPLSDGMQPEWFLRGRWNRDLVEKEANRTYADLLRE